MSLNIRPIPEIVEDWRNCVDNGDMPGEEEYTIELVAAIIAIVEEEPDDIRSLLHYFGHALPDKAHLLMHAESYEDDHTVLGVFLSEEDATAAGEQLRAKARYRKNWTSQYGDRLYIQSHILGKVDEGAL